MNNKFDPTNLPAPLMTNEPDSFVYRTMTTRIPNMVQNILDDYNGKYPAEIVSALQELHSEIIEGKPFRFLKINSPDMKNWNEACQPYKNRSWLNIPWYFAESYFYRRVLEAVGYFGNTEWARVDPFLPRKQAELQGVACWNIFASCLKQTVKNSPHSFEALLQYGVWGNRADLSYTDVMHSADDKISLETEQKNLLVNDTEAVLSHLQTGNPNINRLDFICDNAGAELLTDFALIEFLLKFNWTEKITLHVKQHPTFVSDTTPADIDITLKAMKKQTEATFFTVAVQLEKYICQKRLIIKPDIFWNSSHFFWEIPTHLQAELAQAHLVIIKGDANYRRLLGDSRCWPTTTPYADAVPYFPAPFVSLRTLKSDPIVGLKPGQAENLTEQYPNWRVNGKLGIIQAVI